MSNSTSWETAVAREDEGGHEHGDGPREHAIDKEAFEVVERHRAHRLRRG